MVSIGEQQIFGSSSRFSSAAIVGPLFPSLHRRLRTMIADDPVGESFDHIRFTPWPDETVRRRGDVVEYEDPPNTQGTGTQLWVNTGAGTLHGVVIHQPANYDDDDWVRWSAVRLSAEFENLWPAILADIEERGRCADSDAMCLVGMATRRDFAKETTE